MDEYLYNRIMLANHALIAGTSGAGKSVLLNGALCYAFNHFPESFRLMLIDLKRVELYDYKSTKQCFYYADTIDTAINALNKATAIIDNRYAEMQRMGLRQSNQKILYIVIDELADLMLMSKEAATLIQRISQIGRAANVKLICATRCPITKVIPTQIKVNFDCIVGLRTRSAQDSRNILGMNGCEQLPRYGWCYIDIPDNTKPVKEQVPNCNPNYIKQICNKNKKGFNYYGKQI